MSSKKQRARLYDAPLPYNPLSYDRGQDVDQVRRDREKLFAMAYCSTLDPVESAIRAGYKAIRYSDCKRILELPNVQQEIAKFRKAQEEEFHLKSAEFIRHLHYGAMGRFTKLMKVKMVCCRFCWGKNNEFQRTEQEMNRDLSAHIARQSTLPFDHKGGTGYDSDRQPNLDCTNCNGRGIEKVYFTPTTEFDDEAEAIWDGADVTYEGSKLKKVVYKRVDRNIYLRALLQYYLGSSDGKKRGVIDNYDFDNLTEEQQITMLEVNSVNHLTDDIKAEIEGYLIKHSDE